MIRPIYLVIAILCLGLLHGCEKSQEMADSSVCSNGNKQIDVQFMSDAFWGNTEQVIKLLPYASQYAKEEGLIDASSRGNLAIVQAILANGVQIDPVNENFDTPLRSAAENGQYQVVKFLISKGANVNYQGEDMWTPLMAAAYNGKIQSVRCLLSHGADVKIKDYNGATAADLAAKNGYHEIVMLLTKSQVK
jgi:ankyrin repeat protein